MIVFLLSFQGFSQKLKKKYYGSYSGVIPAFVMDVGGDVAQVEQARITIKLLENNQVEQAIGPQVLTGRWELISINKTEAEIRLILVGQHYTETLVLQLKTQELSRKGFYPQPDAILRKDKSECLILPRCSGSCLCLNRIINKIATTNEYKENTIHVPCHSVAPVEVVK